MLEIGEKEDNHIAYFEVELEGLSLVEEEKKVDEDSEGKMTKVYKEFGQVSPQLTMPPLTLAVPSTS